jgi:hypothetical protein
MARRKPRSAYTIYNHARGDGWILTAQGEMTAIDNGHRIELVLYYTDDQTIETHEVRNTRHTHGVDSFLSGYLDIGGKLGSYPGASPEPNTEYSEQPRAVRMQRHATDIYATLGNATGLSETMAVRAAEEFGSTWREKRAEDWAKRVKQCGEGTANSIEMEMKRRGIIESNIATY